MRSRRAFTLIELLVVLAIIISVAALVVSMNDRAQDLKRRTTVDASKRGLMICIESYQSKLNYFPPDNAALVTNASLGYAIYDATAATNPLVYELTGAVNNYPPNIGGGILLFDGTNVPQSEYAAVYSRTAVNNANPDEPHNFFYQGPKPQELAFYNPAHPAAHPLKGLIVPVPISPNATNANFWHYDSSTTNRHNLSGYDLWAEFITGNKNGSNIITTNGNW